MAEDDPPTKKPPSEGPPSGITDTGRFRLEKSFFASSDGLELATDRASPEGSRGTIFIVHGYAEHAGRYQELVEKLTGEGWSCQLMDLRGHGRSEGLRGFVEDFERYLTDLAALVAKETGPGPRLLLGHSLGGLIAAQYVLRQPQAFSALILSSPFLAPAVDAPAWKLAVGALASQLLPKFSFKGALDPSGLTRDASKVQQYRDDPLIFDAVNSRWFFEVREAQEETLERAGEIALPVLVLVGEGDPVAAPAVGRDFFERLGSGDKQLHVYPDMLHEVFNEVGREQVFKDLTSWLRERFGAAPVAEPG
jgi:alpha-beta hydrolase superfamily lysophospholipase